METVTVSISNELEEGLNSVVSKFGFENKQDFIIAATRDKILELKKQIFFEVSNEVAIGLKKHEVKEQEILEGFEKTRE
ncbi:hypothetical protein BEH94_09800 [Candidatus Altiarchaeales archaeon WOR_SM1_SCG]|nr:hypothetical protein BEH94_09800 [Candidatus Altiarchaeales archaeon WOR_SM1_SCG]